MLSMIGSSVKSIYNTFTNTIKRPNIDFIKIDYLKFNNPDNFMGLCIILVIEKKVNIYLMHINPLNFNLISEIRVYLGNLLTIETINHISFFKKNFPVVSIISNSEQYNENRIEFYSALDSKQLKVLKKKYKIISFKFDEKYFGIGCNHGKIYIHSNKNLDLLFKISQNSILKINEDAQKKSNNKNNVNTATSVILDKNNYIDEEISDSDENNYKSVMLNPQMKQKMIGVKKQKGYYNVLFDINENSIAYEITINNKIKNTDEIIQGNNNTSIFENIIKGTSNSISKFTEWSFNSIQNLNQLRKSYTVSSNTDANKSTTSKLNFSIFNFNSESLCDQYMPYSLVIPFFNEKLGYIKLTSLYLIVGNRENQMFYIFQYYSQTNKKNNPKNNNNGIYKLIYSIWRGYTGGPLSAFDLSNDCRFCTITSFKGTNHIYYLPKRSEQIIENVNFPENLNKTDIASNGFDEILNMNIINVEEIKKINHNNYKDTQLSLFHGILIEIDQLNLEKNLNNKVIEKIKMLNNNKIINSIDNGRYFIELNDNFVYFYMIFNNRNIIKLKKIQLILSVETNTIIQNNQMLIDNNNNECFFNFNKNKNIDDNYPNDTVNMNSFNTIQQNPLFSFWKIDKDNIMINDKKDEKNEKCFYDNLCNDLEYNDVCEVINKSKLDNSLLKGKITENNDENIMFKQQIQESMNKDITELMK